MSSTEHAPRLGRRDRRVQAAAILLFPWLLLLPSRASPQVPGLVGTHNNITDLEHTLSIDRVWPIFGRVISLNGVPIYGAQVKVDLGGGAGAPQVLVTNAKGEFKAEYTLNASLYTQVHARIVASKEGYFVAREAADFLAKDKSTREIIVVLQEESGNSEILPGSSLVSSLEGRFRSPAVLGSVPESARKDFERGAGELFDKPDFPKAVASLTKSVNREPTCINCRLLLCLAQLSAGSISSANQQFAELDKLTSSEKASGERATVFYVAGVFETWRHEDKNAVGFFLKALEIQPSDPVVLLELGRTLIFEKNWEPAEQYLDKAIQSGAPPEARILRARALLEEGDPDSADAEMRAYLGKKNPRELPPAARMVYVDLHQRLELKSFSKVNSVVTQPFGELVKAMPELQGMEPASNQDELPPILQKVGENVAAFFRDFPSTISLEEIRVENLRPNGKVKGWFDEKSNYLLLARPEKWGLGLTEYRASPAGKEAQAVPLPDGFMRTKGFASASVVFHPGCQSGAAFRYLGRQTMDGRETFVLAFAQLPETAKMIGLFIVDGVSEPELTQGVAWADTQNYQIIRMRTDLLKALQKVRLIRQTTQIQYAPVQFKNKPAGLWLPQVVTVTVQWKGRTFRNSHRYSDFKLFNVATEEKRKQASLSPETDANPN